MNVRLDKSKIHLLDPVFANMDFAIEGGSHWSLLVCDLVRKVLYHYDSIGKYNLPVVKITTNIKSEYFGRL